MATPRKKTPTLADQLKAAYLLLAANSGLKEGDTVEIVRFPAPTDPGMNLLGLDDDMQDVVGKRGRITEIDEESGGFFVYIENAREDFYWPFYALRKWVPVTEIKLNDDYDLTIADDGSEVEVGCQTIPADVVFKVAEAVKDRQAWYKEQRRRERDED